MPVGCGAHVGVSVAVGTTRPGWQRPQAGTHRAGPARVASSPCPVPGHPLLCLIFPVLVLGERSQLVVKQGCAVNCKVISALARQ